MNENSWRESADACRADSPDLQQDELQSLRQELSEDADLRATFETSQQLDRQIRDAFQDVSVPEGLEARLLSPLDGSGPTPHGFAPNLVAIPTWRKIAAVAALLLVMVGAYRWTSDRPRFGSENELVQAARHWPGQLSAEWQERSSAPSHWPPEHQLAAASDAWQTIVDGKVTVVCYRLTPERSPLGEFDGIPPHGPQPRAEPLGYLFVLPATEANVEWTSPPGRALSTQGQQVAAWRHGPGVFVLVLNGTAEKYRQLTGQSQNMAVNWIFPHHASKARACPAIGCTLNSSTQPT
jgi:hypothetical protein